MLGNAALGGDNFFEEVKSRIVGAISAGVTRAVVQDRR